MARENTVFLHGQICQPPKVAYNKEGEYVRATFPLKIIRRPYRNGEGQIVTGKLNIDVPIILTMDHKLIEIVRELRQGDMVDVKGVLTTREVNKKTICPCGHQNSVMGNFAFITPIYICRREPELSETAGFDLLKDRSEISNLVMIIGTLCRDPIFYEHADKRGACMTQYQIASNRRYHIKDGHEDERTDYPWIKTVNHQAKDDMEHLKMGSTVYINGALQTRQIERKTVCEECGQEYTWEETVSEIFPYSVEYLMNCVFPETETDNEAEQNNE